MKAIIEPPFKVHHVETDLDYLDIEIYNDGEISFEIDCWNGHTTFELTIADLEELLRGARAAMALDTTG